jgi:hypothetical protein
MPHLIPHSALFRLPKRAVTLTATGIVPLERDLKHVVERENLTGLTFEEIWSEDGPPIRVKTLRDKVKGR